MSLRSLSDSVSSAVPFNCRRLPDRDLPRQGAVSACASFENASTGEITHLFAVDEGQEFRTADEGAWISLRDRFLGHGANMLVFVATSSTDDFFFEELGLPNPKFLLLEARRAPQGGWVVEPTEQGDELVAETIRDFSDKRLFFRGPPLGETQIGIEVMRDACFRCGQPMSTVTGLVFPDRLLGDRDWQKPHWKYYGRLVALAELDETTVEDMKRAIDRHGQFDCKIEYRYSQATKDSYWAAVCPSCDVIRGHYFALEERHRHLHQLLSRTRGELSYVPETTEIDSDGYALLFSGGEVNPHVAYSGWCRSGDTAITEFEAGGESRGMTAWFGS